MVAQFTFHFSDKIVETEMDKYNWIYSVIIA